MLLYTITTVLLILVSLSYEGYAKNCFATDRKKKVGLCCPKKSWIYQPVVRQSNVSCQHTSNSPCVGLTPIALVETNECYWKRKCIVTHNPKQLIIKSLDETNNCVGHRAKRLEIQSYMCIPSDSVFTMYPDRNEMSSPHRLQHLDAGHGLLRSHSAYPWQYGHTSDVYEARIFVKVGEVLLMTLNDVNIDSSKDNLTVKSISNEVLVQFNGCSCTNGLKHLNFSKTGYVSIKFNTGVRSNFGRGFIICFQKIWAKDFSGNMQNTDVCKKIAKQKMKKGCCGRKCRNSSKKNGRKNQHGAVKKNKICLNSTTHQDVEQLGSTPSTGHTRSPRKGRRLLFLKERRKSRC